MTDDVVVKFGADIGEVNAKMAELQGKVKEGVAGIQDTFAKLGTAMAAFTAILAGGEMFKEMIASTIEMSTEANKLAHTLGITATEGSTLAVALDDVHSSSEQYLGISQRLMRQVKSNEEGLNKFGLATRDSSGHLKGQRELMLDAIKILNEYKEGTDRNQAAMKIFGGRVGDITQLLKLNTEVMEAAKRKQEELGMTVTPNNIKAMLAYKDMLNDVSDVMKAVEKVIGDVVIPRLTALGNWFSQNGPTAVKIMAAAMRVYTAAMDTVGEVVRLVWGFIVQAFRGIGDAINAVFGVGGSGITPLEFVVNVFKVVEIAIVGFRLAFELAFEAINTVLLQSMSWINRFANVIQAALHMDWAGIKSAWKAGGEELDAINQQAMNNMVAAADKAKAEIDKIVMRPISTSASDEGPGQAPKKTSTKTMADERAVVQEVSNMKVYEAALLEMKISSIEDNGREMTKAEEDKFWKDMLAMQTEYSVDTEALQNKVRQAKLAGLSADLKTTQKYYADMLAPIKSAIDGTVNGILQGTLTLQKALSQILQSILVSYIQMGIKNRIDWVATELAKTSATNSGVAARLAAEKAAAATAIGTAKVTAAGVIPA